MADGPVTCPFSVVRDTREQRGWQFDTLRADARQGRRPLAVPVVVGTLRQGDYSVVGMEGWVAVERKSLCDLFNTLGQHRRRFEAELARLQGLTVAAVVVEADWRDVLASPPSRSQLNPKTVFRSVVAWTQRFPLVHWFFMPTRAAAEATCFRFLERFWLDHQPRGYPPPATRECEASS